MSAAELASWAEWQIKNQNTAIYYAAAIAGITGAFAMIYWTNVLHSDHKWKPGALHTTRKAFLHTYRRLNSSIILVDLPPAQIFFALHYFGGNAVLTFYDAPQKFGLTILAKRFGWMCLLNLCLTVFLGLKNTPLSPIAGCSHESVNVLHKCVGATTVLFVVLHAATYLAGLSQYHALYLVMTETPQYFGAAAGISMLLILVTAVGPVRKQFYETFYIVHLVLVTVILITVGLHRPDISLKALIVTIVAASIWFADKSVRLSRWLYHGVGNYCTVVPLPDEAVRVTMHRQMRAQPGSHAFLWIPGLRILERHPFTLVSTHPAEFIVKARSGFTKDLYLAACDNPGAQYKAAVEGPYGNVPDVFKHDKVVLMAGGSGVTFTISLALAWARKRRTPDDGSTLEFIWSVQDSAALDWLGSEIAELRASPRVTVRLHVTRNNHNPPSESESNVYLDHTKSEKAMQIKSRSTPGLLNNYSISLGRPDVSAIVQHASSSMPGNSSVLVAACGPAEFLSSVRVAVADCTTTVGPAIEQYLEEYSI